MTLFLFFFNIWNWYLALNGFTTIEFMDKISQKEVFHFFIRNLLIHLEVIKQI
jgi:hypothetical protein